MYRRLRWSLFAALVPLVGLFSGAALGETPLEWVPDDAVAFVLVNHLAETSGKIQAAAGRLELPLPPPLDLFKGAAGIERGLDEKGAALLVLMPGPVAAAKPAENKEQPEKDDEPTPPQTILPEIFPVAFLPITDYKQFVTQFGAQDPSAPIITVPVAGAPAVIGHKGKYAVIAEPDHKEALQAILKAEAPGAAFASLKPFEDWLAGNDLATGLTPHGVKFFAQAGLETIDRQKALFDEQGFDLNQPGFGQVAQTLDMYRSVIQLMGAEVAAFVSGARLSAEGDLHAGFRVLVAHPEMLAGVAGLTDATGTSLGPLPNLPYAGALGGVWPAANGRALVEWSMRMIRANPQMYGFEKLSDEDARKLADLSLQGMKRVRWMSMMMAVDDEKEYFYSKLLAAIGVDDAAKYLAEYDQSLKAWNAIAKKAGDSKAISWEMEHIKIAGAPGLKMTMDFAGLIHNQGLPGMDEMFKALVGPSGKLTAYLAVANQQTVLMTYSLTRLEKWLASYRDDSGKLGQDPTVVALRGKLPAKAAWAGYISPSGVITLVNQLLRAVVPGVDLKAPPFPKVPPVAGSFAVSKLAFEVDLIVPAPTIKGIYDYGRRINEHEADPFE